jgi:2-haloacid dehalogenase
MTKSLHDYKVLTFDCYGTLIDWESGIWDALQPLLMAAGRDDIHREAALASFGVVESAQQAATPGMLYSELLARCHRTLAERYDIPTTSALDAAFGASLPHWPAFPDSADALRALKRHYKLAILSNVHRDGFAASKRKLGVAFDAVYTAQDIGSYKPSPANFEYLLARLKSDLGLAKEDVLHTAQSLFHDHAPARAFGLANAWIDRQGLAKGGSWGATAQVAKRPTVDFLYPSLAAMAAEVVAA